MDIYCEGKPVEPRTLRELHLCKTSALIESSCVAGAILAGAPAPQIRAIRRYGRSLGLAFQIIDDLLDVVGDEKLAGKRLRKDGDKATYPGLFGVDGARRLARAETLRARAALRAIPRDCALLDRMAERLFEREF